MKTKSILLSFSFTAINTFSLKKKKKKSEFFFNRIYASNIKKKYFQVFDYQFIFTEVLCDYFAKLEADFND